jgi:Transposase IS116/IS110/IS902 family
LATSATCPASPAGITSPPWNGTAPAGVSPGKRKIYRLSRRGNRRLNHAIHMAAVTQIRYRHSQGSAWQPVTGGMG